MTRENKVEDSRWVGDHPGFLAHMNTLQSIVTRLAANCASCKTWCMGTVTALLGLAGATHAPGLLALALAPVIVFGVLDANYLAQERWFRSQFNAFAKKAQSDAYNSGDLFAINMQSRSETVAGFARAFASWSIFPVYGGLILAYLVASKAGLLALLSTAK